MANRRVYAKLSATIKSMKVKERKEDAIRIL